VDYGASNGDPPAPPRTVTDDTVDYGASNGDPPTDGTPNLVDRSVDFPGILEKRPTKDGPRWVYLPFANGPLSLSFGSQVHIDPADVAKDKNVRGGPAALGPAYRVEGTYTANGGQPYHFKGYVVNQKDGKSWVYLYSTDSPFATGMPVFRGVLSNDGIFLGDAKSPKSQFPRVLLSHLNPAP
jgi:hypothetical protein